MVYPTCMFRHAYLYTFFPLPLEITSFVDYNKCIAKFWHACLRVWGCFVRYLIFWSIISNFILKIYMKTQVDSASSQILKELLQVRVPINPLNHCYMTAWTESRMLKTKNQEGDLNQMYRWCDFRCTCVFC